MASSVRPHTEYTHSTVASNSLAFSFCNPAHTSLPPCTGNSRSAVPSQHCTRQALKFEGACGAQRSKRRAVVVPASTQGPCPAPEPRPPTAQSSRTTTRVPAFDPSPTSSCFMLSCTSGDTSSCVGGDTHGSHHSDHLASHLSPCPLHHITALASVSVAGRPLPVASTLARSPTTSRSAGMAPPPGVNPAVSRRLSAPSCHHAMPCLTSALCVPWTCVLARHYRDPRAARPESPVHLV